MDQSDDRQGVREGQTAIGFKCNVADEHRAD
jgi:hypothetical protein